MTRLQRMVRLAPYLVAAFLFLCATGSQQRIREMAAAEHDDDVVKTQYVVDAKEVFVVLDFKRLAASPKWDPAQADPPVSPRQAHSRAKRALAQTVARAEDWLVYRMTLKHGGEDEWHWQVVFIDGGEKEAAKAEFIVLLVYFDGTVSDVIPARE